MVQSTGIDLIIGGKEDWGKELEHHHQDSFQNDFNFIVVLVKNRIESRDSEIWKLVAAYEWATQDPVDPNKIVFIGDEAMGFGFSTIDTSTATIV